MDFHGLNRKKLQELCKKHGIPANLKNVEMADRLSSLLLKEEMPDKLAAAKQGRSCLKNVSEDVEVVECEKVGLDSKEVKKVRFSPENQTFLFERTDPRAVRLLARKKRAFVNSRKKEDPVVVSENLEESGRLGVVSDDVGRVVEPVGRRNLRRRSVVTSENVGLVGENDENVVKLAVQGGNLGRNLRSRRGEVILETNESVEMVSKEKNVVKGRNLRRNSRQSLVEAKDLGLESENVDDGEKLPTKEANLELNLRSRRSKMKQDDVEVISLLSPCLGDNVNKPETVDHVEKLPTKEDNMELNLRSRRCKIKQDDVEGVSLLSPCGGVGGDNDNKPVEGRNPKRSLRSRGGIEENGVGGASLLSPCVEKKAKRGTKGKGIAEEGGGEEVDRPQNEMVNHGGNIGRVTRKQLRNVNVVVVNLERDDDSVAEVSGLNNLKRRGRPRKSARLAEHSPEMILEPLENKGIKRGRRKTLMVKQHDINEDRDVVVEKLGEGNNMVGNGSRESAKKSRKDVKAGNVEELGDIRRSSRRAAKTKVDTSISVTHQSMNHDERVHHMIEGDSSMPAQLESRNPEVNEQYKATEEINAQLPINDETTSSLLRNNGDDEANMGHECPCLVVATEEVNVQIPINNIGGDGTRESAKRSRRNDKNGSVEGLDYIRRSGRRAAKNTVDISWSNQTMLHVERIDHMIENDSQMVAQIGRRSPEGNEQYQATEAVNVHMPINDDSTTALLQNRDDDEANKAQDCPDLVVATDNVSEDKNASPCSMTAQICDAIEANHSGEKQTTRSLNEVESGMMASETLESSLVLQHYGPNNEEKWPEKSSRPSKNDETTYQDVNGKPDVIETAHITSNDVVPGDSTPAGNASDYRNPNTEGTSEPICSSAIQPTLLRSRESVCVHEDTNIVRNCEDFESNGVPELHDFEVNEQRKEEEFEELSSPCKDNEMGSELLEDSAIFVDNLNVQLTEPSKVYGTTGACKSISVHEPPSSSRTDTNIMRNSEEFESNGVPELHNYEMNEQSREDEGFEELATPCKDIAIGSELLEASEIIVDKLGVQLTEQSKASGSTGVCNSICVHDEQPASSQSDTRIMKTSKDFESNGVPKLHDYEMIKQSTEDEVFDELSSPCKDNSMGSVLLESAAIVDKLDVQLTEQSKHSRACNNICLPEKQPSNSRSDIDIMTNSEGFESNGVEQAVDKGFEELSSPCKDNATGSELLEVSAVIGDKFDVQLTEQSKVSGSTGVSNSIFKEADETISEISAAEVERREESCNDTSGGKLLCSANVFKTDHFVEFDKTTLEPSEQAKDTQPFILEDDFNNTTEASGFTAASFGSESMQPNIDEHYGATRDNFYVEQKSERFSGTIAFSPSSSEQLPVTHNTMQVEDYSSGESGVKKAHENAEQYVQTLANAAAAAVPLYQSPRPCNSIESASLRSSEAQYDNSTSEQQELADNSNDFEYCLQHLFSEADILNTNGIKGLGSITDDDDDEEEDLKETRSVSQVTMFKVDSSLRGEVADDIEGPSRDEMDMDDEDLETHSVSQVKGSKADSSLRKLVANDIEGPSTADMDVDNNQKSVLSLNEDSETKTCRRGKSNTILAASVSMELLKDENIEEATKISPSTLQLNMEYSMRLSEECDGEKESEMNSLILTNHGGSHPSLIQMTDTCTEVQEKHVSTPPIIVQGTLNDNFESNVRLANSPENGNELGYNMAGSNVGLTEQEEVDSSRWKSDIIYKECDDGQWPTEFTSDEKLDVGGEASVKGRVQSPSIMGETTPKVSPATLWKLMDDAKEVVTVTCSRLQDGMSDGRSKKCKSESDISVQTSLSYLKTRVIGEPTVFSGSIEKGEECCKESPIGDIACSGNTKKVDYSIFIQKSPNEDANSLGFEDDLMNFDKEIDLESDKTASVTEGDDGHYVFSKDEKLNESPSEEANNSVFKDDLMNLEKERDMDSDKTPRVIKGNDDGHYISSQDKKLNESSHQDANNLVFEDDLMNFDKERDLESDKTLRSIEGNDEGHHVFSQDKKLNESASEDANNLVFEDDLMNFDNERDLESDKTSRVTEGNDEEHHVSSQDNTLNGSANENANNVVFENDLMNLDKESDLECDKISRVTEGNNEDHVSSQDNKSNESANEAANDIVFEDDFMNFDKERDLESDKTLKVAEGHHVSPHDRKSNECANEDANNLVFEDELMSFDKERDLESDKTLRSIEGNDEGHHVFSQDKKLNESASEDANNLVFEDDLMNFDNERDLESDKTSRVTEGNDEEHHVSSQDNTLNGSANENANNVVFENDLMNLDKECDLESDKISRVTEGNNEDHVSSQDNKSNESANEAANDIVFQDDFMNFDKERDLESDKTLKVAEGHHVSPHDRKSNECANEDANNLVFEDELMSFDKERDLESDKPSRVTEGNDGGHCVSSQEKKSNELQFHRCSNSSNADLSSFIMGFMEKDMSEMFQAEESTPFLSHDETNHKLDDLFSNQFPHESDSRPDQHGNIVMAEAEELVAWNSAMHMHHETTSEVSYPTDDGNTGQNQLKFSSGKDIHANCVVNVTEINEDDNLAMEGLCPLHHSEKKTGEMDELFEVDPEVKSLPSSNSLCEMEDTNHLRGCKQVEMETSMDTAALEDGSGDKLCAEAGSYITDAQRVNELDATDDKMMLKRRNRSELIYGTPRKPLLPTIDMKENMAAPKRMQMVNATATKPGIKRKALGKIWK